MDMLKNEIIGEFGVLVFVRVFWINCLLMYLNFGYNVIGEIGVVVIGEVF